MIGLLALVVSVAIASGQEASPKSPADFSGTAAGKSTGPPLAVGGFKYVFLPPGTHMNDCAHDSCVVGSKVSYIVGAPSDISFATYKAQRQQIAQALKNRFGPRVALEFNEPTQKSDGVVKIFESRRVDTLATGEKRYTVSNLLMTPNMNVDLISSSGELKAAEANLAQFVLAAMVLTTLEPAAKRQP